ncbi:restriction endonuclease subunit S [Thiomonas intermedia]|uniref:restriction endonuclease subunit S n=1 Tax=Thiomonas intermedia TaxID=926 RepID=UPI0009A52EA1|nr:restriction endonuclease subunit S [Thiomonas intermedia]
MEVREPSAKYLVSQCKRTEAGDIPFDWIDMPIGAIAEVTSGGTPSRKVAAFWDGDIPWVTTAELDGGQITAASQHITAAGLQNSAAKWLAPGTLLIALYGQGKTRGKCAVLRIAATTNQACAAITLAKEVDSDFVRHNLTHRYEYIRSLSNGGSQENLSGLIVKQIRVGLPPTRTEQHSIASALTDADALIDSLEQLLTKKRQIKQGAMQELLTGKRRLPGFDRPWKESKLCQLGTFLKGSGVRRDEALSGDLPCVRYGEIYTTHSDHIRSFSSWISPVVAATSTVLRRGDLLFAGSGETKEEIGKCVAFLYNEPAYAGGDIVILRPTVEADSMFLGYLLNMPFVVRQKASRGQGDAVVHISANALGEIEVELPEVPEQTTIAQVLSDMDTELTALESRLTKARALKQAMAQALLTGKIRLN